MRGAKKVIGYEINRRYLDIAYKNVKTNGFDDQIDLNYCAVARKKIRKEDEILKAVMLKEDIKIIEQLKFKTLDEVTNEITDRDPVLKIDVDGYEYEILDSINPKYLNNYSHIVLEYHFGLKKIPQILENAGFKLNIKKIRKIHIEDHPHGYKEMNIGIIYATRKKRL